MVRKRRRRHTILADEHIDRRVLDSLTALNQFRIVRADKDRGYRGRNEWDYVGELRSQSIIFLTQDGEFVRHVLRDRVRHGGVIWLPAGWAIDELEVAVCVAAGRALCLLDQSASGMHDIVVKVEPHGVRMIGAKSEDFYSLDALQRDIEQHLGKTIFD